MENAKIEETSGLQGEGWMKGMGGDLREGTGGKRW